MTKKKKPSDSCVETRYLVMPHQANTYGTAFGGVIMSWIDMVAAMTAHRHCEGIVVTASIDKITFLAPISIGDQVLLKANVNYVGSTSMEVGVQVIKENPVKGISTRATTAYLTFVHLDDQGKSAEVPKLELTTDDEHRRYENAKLRVAARKELREKIKK